MIRNVSKIWGGRNLIGISFLLALASTFAHAQDAAPAISSVFFGSSPARGDTYELGETVVVFVQFDGPVETTDQGEFQMALAIGAETQYATYTGGCIGGRCGVRYRFEYTVQEPDRDEDGISIPANALTLNGGTITATDGTTDADLTHAPVGPERDRKVDGSSDVTPPRVKAIIFDTSPARGDTYELGETVKVSVEFDGPVEAGTFQLALTIGTETRYATMFSRAIGRHWYYFEYTVQEGDRDEDGISIPANALILISGAVTDPSGTVDADLTHGTVAADAGRKVNGSLASPPAVKRVYLFSFPPAKGDIYGPGETVRVGVEFDRAVTMTGNPQVALTIGTQTRHAAYSWWWRDDRTLDFAYVVQEGDRDEDGISIPANAVVLNGGTIKLAADSTIDADLTHAAVARDPTRKVSGSRASP